MCGEDIIQKSLFTTVHLGTFVPSDHPLRPVRQLIDKAMNRLNWLCDRNYAEGGQRRFRPSDLYGHSCVQEFYFIHSERQPVEPISCELRYR